MHLNSSDLGESALKKKFVIFLLLTIIAGFVVQTPFMNLTFSIAQGDHGRDMYSFKKTFEGAAIYKDYYSANGPLMPYYYSLIYKIFGVSVQSTLIGHNILIILTGIFLYLVCTNFLSATLSFLCALWYWAFRGAEFFYTYNHNGALLLTIIVLYCIFKYIKDPNNLWSKTAPLPLFLIFLIRPSIGIGTSVAFYAGCILTDFTKKNPKRVKNLILYGIELVAIFGFSYIVYWAFTKGLAGQSGGEDLAYAENAKILMVPKALALLWKTLKYNLIATWSRKIFSIILFGMLIKVIHSIRNNKYTENTLNYALSLIVILLFIFINLGEFYFSAIWFRYIWIIPFIYVLIFHIIELGTKELKKPILYLLYGLIFIQVFFPLQKKLEAANYFKKPQNLVQIESNKFYVSDQQLQWKYTVEHVSHFIIQNVPSNEKIFAYAYDPIYYFLTNRDSAARDFIFLGSTPQVDAATLEQLKSNNVNWILVSNRSYRSFDERFVEAGKDFGVELNNYILSNFTDVATFGPWEATAGWNTNHAVKIYKRK